MTVRWAFWRRRSSEPQRALPDDVGLPIKPRPAPAPRDEDDDHTPVTRPTARTSGATPTAQPDPTYAAPPAAPTPDVDRAALAAAGRDLAGIVTALRTHEPGERHGSDARTLAIAATGALAARLPALSGLDGAAVFGEPEDELLHAYADVLVRRAQTRRAPFPVDREDLLAVAHLAAAAAAVDAAGDPVLLLLAGVPPDEQLRAAALLLAQTADDGGRAPDRLVVEVRELFTTQR